LQPVRLDLLAHEEPLGARASRERRAGERIGAHGRAADRRAAPRRHLRGEQERQRGEAVREQDRALGVDVVLGLAAAGERDLAEHERVLAKAGDEASAGALETLHIFVEACQART
jgi:hypothetical protein